MQNLSLLVDAALMSFILNIKKDFDFIFIFLLVDLCNIILLFTACPRSDFMSVLPQRTYGNIAFIALVSMVTKNEIFAHLM
jgi:hypothetical protein